MSNTASANLSGINLVPKHISSKKINAGRIGNKNIKKNLR